MIEQNVQTADQLYARIGHERYTTPDADVIADIVASIPSLVGVEVLHLSSAVVTPDGSADEWVPLRELAMTTKPNTYYTMRLTIITTGNTDDLAFQLDFDWPNSPTDGYLYFGIEDVEYVAGGTPILLDTGTTNGGKRYTVDAHFTSYAASVVTPKIANPAGNVGGRVTVFAQSMIELFGGAAIEAN